MANIRRRHRLNLHRAREMLAFGYVYDMLDDDFVVLFLKNDLPRLKHALSIPDTVICRNGSRVDGLEGLCIMLARHAYPCRFCDMMKTFGKSVPQFSLIYREMTDLVFDNCHNLLESMDQEWLSPVNLSRYAAAVYAKGAAIPNCWGFVDGTVRPVCRPKENQRVMYNGHKRLHAMKFQSIVAANGLIANLFGPVEGRRHDCFMLRESGLLNELEQRSFDPEGNILCIYGDPAYPLRAHLQAPFKGNNLTEIQTEFNKAMSSVRISVEWLLGDITSYFKFVDFKKSNKSWLSACGTMYTVCSLLTNAHTCLYGTCNSTSKYFGLDPPTLEEYFQVVA
nr:uncharacterized protein LOC129270405 [Lytechinus pictus]